MAVDNGHDPQNDTRERLRAALDRFMQSTGLAQARDTVAENPLLLGPEVADYLSEAAKRTRQSGDVEFAEKCEFWLDLLRSFREFGVQEGYLELAINQLVRAPNADEERSALREYPELTSKAAEKFIRRRHRESVNVADTNAEGKYQLALTLISARGVDSDETSAQIGQQDDLNRLTSEDPGMNEAINTFLSRFILESDLAAGRHLLETRPDLLQSPRSVFVSSMFQPYIERARAGTQLVRLRDLLLRKALFGRCQEVGVAQAYEELANGVRWTLLSTK